MIKQDGIIVGDDARKFGRDQTAYDPWRYLCVSTLLVHVASFKEG